MKKSFKFSLLALCVAVIASVCAFTACNLLNYPKVAGCSYEYDRTECDKSNLTASQSVSLETSLASYRANVNGLTMTFSDDGKSVEYKKLYGDTETYRYQQVFGDVIVYNAPNQNSNFSGEMVTGYTVSKSGKDVLKWHMVFLVDGVSADVYMYFNLVTADSDAE